MVSLLVLHSHATVAAAQCVVMHIDAHDHTRTVDRDDRATRRRSRAGRAARRSQVGALAVLLTELMLLCTIVAVAAQRPVMPGGPYGLARTPPRGFRTWNAFQDRVTQKLMSELMDAMVAKQSDGRSLLDLGYRAVGLDDGWQSCGGPGAYNGSHHTASGDVLVNLTRFPDMRAMVNRAHALNLTAAFYMNNCVCSVPSQDRGHGGVNETGAWPAWSNTTFLEAAWHGNIRFLKQMNYDGVKVDNGGPLSDSGYFAQKSGYSWAGLLQAARLPMVLESCNMAPFPTNASTPCPYNFFRTSRDLRPTWRNIMNNLATTVPFLGSQPISRPGCWANPE